jgi:hypothetical protein
MTELQRLVLDFRTEKLVARCLYRSKGDSNPGTKEVVSITRTGLEQALDALEGGAECVGTSGFTTREDVLLATVSLGFEDNRYAQPLRDARPGGDSRGRAACKGGSTSTNARTSCLSGRSSCPQQRSTIAWRLWAYRVPSACQSRSGRRSCGALGSRVAKPGEGAVADA